MKYGYKKEINSEFNGAVESVKDELKKQGFGVLTGINVKETLKKKLDINYENYIILGACNPEFAYNALKAEKDIGLLLPCNVIIYQTNGKTFVSVINPRVAMEAVENTKLKEIAERVEDKLKEVLANVG